MSLHNALGPTPASPSADPAPFVSGFYVHIIESPDPGEMRTGQFESKCLAEFLNLIGIPYLTSLVVNEEQLTIALTDDIRSGVQSFQRHPIVHFSVHGGEDGVQLTSQRSNGDVVEWTRLGELLGPIHQAMPNGLGLSLSCCGGIHGRKMARVFETTDVPFSWLVGTGANIDLRDAALAFAVFYRGFQRGESTDGLINAMRIASGASDFDIVWGSLAQQQYRNEMNLLFSQFLRQFPQGKQPGPFSALKRR